MSSLGRSLIFFPDHPTPPVVSLGFPILSIHERRTPLPEVRVLDAFASLIHDFGP